MTKAEAITKVLTWFNRNPGYSLPDEASLNYMAEDVVRGKRVSKVCLEYVSKR